MALRQRQLVLATAVLALASLAALAMRHHATSSVRRAEHALAQAGSCLLGRPIGHVEEPNRWLRATQIAASVDPARHADFPARCAPHTAALVRTATELRAERVARVGAQACADDEGCAAATTLLEESNNLASFVASWRTGSLDLDRLVAAARTLGLSTDRAAQGVQPPAPATLLDPRAMTPLYTGDYLRLLTDPPGDDRLDLLFYEHRRRYGLCTLGLEADEEAHCRVLPAVIPVGFAGELFASEADAPTLLYAHGPGTAGWVEGLFDVADGAMLSRLDGRPSGGFVWRDGSFARLSVDSQGERVELVVRDPQGREQVEQTELGPSLSAGPRLLWDEIVWASSAEPGYHELYAQRVARPDEPLGPIVPLGKVGPMPSPSLDFCRTSEALVLLVGDVRARRAGTAALVFRTESGWHRPHLLRVASEQTGFTCEADTATLSWVGGKDDWLDASEAPAQREEEPRPVRGRYRAHRLRCDPLECDHATAEVVLRRHGHDSRYVAGDLGSSTVVLWRSPLGDVRMRLGPIDRLDRAVEIPLFDDLEHDGFGWDLERHPIFGRGEAVVVLLGTATEEGAEPRVYGIRIDAAGRAAAVSVGP